MGRIFLLTLALVSVSAFGQITVENPSVRAMPPGQPNTAAFMLMRNKQDTAIRLTGLFTPVAKKAEFHSHTKDEAGIMRMRKEAYVEIPAGGTFQFQSGGHHIMLMGLQKTLKPGDIVPLIVEDSDGTQYNFKLPVKALVEKQGHSHHHHHH